MSRMVFRQKNNSPSRTEQEYERRLERYYEDILERQSVKVCWKEQPIFTDLALAIEKTEDRWVSCGKNFHNYLVEREYKDDIAAFDPVQGQFKPFANGMNRIMSRGVAELAPYSDKNTKDILGYYTEEIAYNPYVCMTVNEAVRLVRYTLQYLATLQTLFVNAKSIHDGTFSRDRLTDLHVDLSESISGLLSTYTLYMSRCHDAKQRLGVEGQIELWLPTIRDCVPVLGNFVGRYHQLNKVKAAYVKEQLVLVLQSIKAIDEIFAPKNKQFHCLMPVTETDYESNNFLDTVFEWFYLNKCFHEVYALYKYVNRDGQLVEYTSYRHVTGRERGQIKDAPTGFNFMEQLLSAAICNQDGIDDTLFFLETLDDHVMQRRLIFLMHNMRKQQGTWRKICGETDLPEILFRTRYVTEFDLVETEFNQYDSILISEKYMPLMKQILYCEGFHLDTCVPEEPACETPINTIHYRQTVTTRNGKAISSDVRVSH